MRGRVEHLSDSVTLYLGDCLDALAEMESCSIDACVTDPPYGLGFMGKHWDHGVPGVKYWREVFRVLKPGAHLLSFGGTRTYHRMACAIEDAGFEIRDQLQYLYGSGFPKSLNVAKAASDEICSCPREAIPERDVRSVRDADVPSPLNAGDERSEILLAGMPEQGSQSDGSASRQPVDVRSNESGLEGWRDLPAPQGQLRPGEVRPLPARTDFNGAGGWLRNGASPSDGALDRSTADPSGMRSPQRPSTTEQCADELGTVALQPQSQKRRTWDHCGRCGKPIIPESLGTALKPACEPIVLARKPLSESTVAANVLKWGTGAINVDGCRVGMEGGTKGENYAKTGLFGIGGKADITQLNLGRWPANIIHDGSEEVVGAFPDAGAHGGGASGLSNGYHGGIAPGTNAAERSDGSAARFFYTAKADSDDRIGSKHPTVKPLDLMRYLVRLVTPPKGLVLDPFAGTGTTGEAAFREGMRAILIEREEEYQEDIRRRMKLAVAGPDERARESAKARMRDKPIDHGPLFGAQS